MTERGQNILTKEKLLAIGDLMEEKLAADRAQDAPYR
jgi:NADH-quinone oxidoreductase subunit I